MGKKGGVRHAHKGGKHSSKRQLKQNDKGKVFSHPKMALVSPCMMLKAARRPT